MEKQGVISLGEAFIDYISTDSTNTKFRQLLGGATVNLAVGTSRLVLPTYYLCKLGTDSISQFVEQEFNKEGVNLEFSVRTDTKKICGVYVHLTESGERNFHSYINTTPDEVLRDDELRRDVFEKTRIFYFGSGTLFQQKSKKTTETALKYAKEFSNLIAFDANLRLKRWESETHCRQTVVSFLKHANIVKLAEDELNFLMETNSLEGGLEKISKWDIPYLFITMGGKGACGVMNGNKVFIRAPKVDTIDTTGAGDAFMSGLLYCFHEKGMPAGKTELTEYLQFANRVGAAATTEIGSLTSSMDLMELKKHFKKWSF
ncbi:carbohydrate kinase family protein [Neobacillus niacini]|uniref:carbohydrate kinase family protein n=1 Tax=Neobacillus niacini TaxID=86668 RepID=UPI0006942653|nr:carbohydrate kinase [Neobacillus niacini]